MTADLAQYLRDRLDETAAKARAQRQASPAWYYDDAANEVRDQVNSGTVAFVPTEADAEHIVEHDPAHVLADVEAKRRLVEDMASVVGGDWYDAGELVLAEYVLCLLALPYAKREDYRKEWKP